jgi:hypothetical protein
MIQDQGTGLPGLSVAPEFGGSSGAFAAVCEGTDTQGGVARARAVTAATPREPAPHGEPKV